MCTWNCSRVPTITVQTAARNSWYMWPAQFYYSVHVAHSLYCFALLSILLQFAPCFICTQGLLVEQQNMLKELPCENKVSSSSSYMADYFPRSMRTICMADHNHRNMGIPCMADHFSKSMVYSIFSNQPLPDLSIPLYTIVWYRPFYNSEREILTEALAT